MSDLATFLSGAYYAVAITVVCIGLVTWLVQLQQTVKALEKCVDQIDKNDVASTTRIDQRIDDLEKTGSRHAMERISVFNEKMSSLMTLSSSDHNRIAATENELRRLDVLSTRLTDFERRLESVERRPNNSGHHRT